MAVGNERQGVGALNAQNRGVGTSISPGGDLLLGQAVCAACGQCTLVCPVNALKEKDATKMVWDALADPELTVVVQTAPAVRAALGEPFGMPPGSLVTGKMAAALRRMGFDAVFDTNFTADLTILEEGYELLGRLAAGALANGSVTREQLDTLDCARPSCRKPVSAHDHVCSLRLDQVRRALLQPVPGPPVQVQIAAHDAWVR